MTPKEFSSKFMNDKALTHLLRRYKQEIIYSQGKIIVTNFMNQSKMEVREVHEEGFSIILAVVI